jgi:hypothetical protein
VAKWVWQPDNYHTDADWWARVVQARTKREDLRPQRVWALRKGEHEAAIDLRAVPGVGAEIVLTVNGGCDGHACIDRTSRRRWSARLPTHGRRSRRRGGRDAARHEGGQEHRSGGAYPQGAGGHLLAVTLWYGLLLLLHRARVVAVVSGACWRRSVRLVVRRRQLEHQHTFCGCLSTSSRPRRPGIF